MATGPTGAMAEWTGRIVWWRAHHVVSCQGPSPAHPFEAIDGWHRCFAGRDSLEIGPGAGRQAAALMPHCQTYTVADIVPEILALPLYQPAGRFQIHNYRTDRMGRTFGVISFWYLVHHLRADEIDDFFDFIAAHAHEGADLLFNIPGPTPPHTLLAEGPGDGRKTTPHDPARVCDTLTARGFTLRSESMQDYSSHVMHWTKPA